VRAVTGMLAPASPPTTPDDLHAGAATSDTTPMPRTSRQCYILSYLTWFLSGMGVQEVAGSNPGVPDYCSDHSLQHPAPAFARRDAGYRPLGTRLQRIRAMQGWGG
jgi:hypothetical protein